MNIGEDGWAMLGLFRQLFAFLVALYSGRVTEEHLRGVGEVGGPGELHVNHVMGSKQREVPVFLDRVMEMDTDCDAARTNDYGTGTNPGEVMWYTRPRVRVFTIDPQFCL